MEGEILMQLKSLAFGVQWDKDILWHTQSLFRLSSVLSVLSGQGPHKYVFIFYKGGFADVSLLTTLSFFWSSR